MDSLSAAPTNNLPVQATRFISRAREAAAAVALLQQPGVRLLTLTGPGGTGKTRLGLYVAAELVDSFAQGLAFVPLAPIGAASLVISTVAGVLGVKESADEPLLNTLKSFLRECEMLLLLDNFEHVLAAAPAVAELLAAAPRIKVLVTSRSPIHVYGEHEFAVPPMTVPVGRDLPPPEQLSQYEAVQLFLERARAVKPDFAINSGNAAAIAEITSRLDGLPLAIELAATRIKILTPAAMLARMTTANNPASLRLLTGGGSDLPLRQQTLRNAIDWSHDLLTPAEQALFRRLAVFSGGCTLPDAESILEGDGDVFDGMLSLVNSSLLRQQEVEDGDTRFWMLETIREYALEKLAAAGEEDALRRRHAEFFLALAEDGDARLRGPEQLYWLKRLEAEHSNIRAALDWCAASGEAAMGLRFVGALNRFWYLRGHFSESRQRAAQALDAAGAAGPTAARIKALYTAGFHAGVQGDVAQARVYHEEALQIARELGDNTSIATALNELATISYRLTDYAAARTLYEESLKLRRALPNRRAVAIPLNNLGVMAVEQGEYQRARELYQESLDLFRELDDAHSIATTLANLGTAIAYGGDYSGAEPLYDESLSIRQAVGDKYGIAHVLYEKGFSAQGRGDLSGAAALYDDSLRIRQDIGDRSGSGWSLLGMGTVQLAQGDGGAAGASFRRSLGVFVELGDKRGVAEALAGLGEVAAAAAQWSRSARLLGAAEGILAAIGAVMLPVYRPAFEAALAHTQAALGDRAAALLAEGRAMLPGDATRYAQSDEDTTPEAAAPTVAAPVAPAPATAPTPLPAGGYPGGLSVREAEVLKLVAQGMTNAEVADKLILSTFTVNAHLRAIYSKLGITSRSAAVRFALDHNLA